MESDLGKLFIGGISWDTNEDRLREYFGQFGEVVKAVIMKDRTTGRARGFGFVIFKDPAVAERVVMTKHQIDGRMVEAKKAIPRDDQRILLHRKNNSHRCTPGPLQTGKIFVGGLPSTITEAEFKSYFERFGTITDVVVMYDHFTQRPRGFGFITFSSEDGVDRVLQQDFYEINGKMAEVKKAIPKELSPGPSIRPPVGAHNYSLNGVNNFLNLCGHGYNPSSLGCYGMRMDNTSGPVTGGRKVSPFIPGNEIGLSPSYGDNLNLSSNIGYGRALNPYCSGNENGFISPSYGENLNLSNNIDYGRALNPYCSGNPNGFTSPSYGENLNLSSNIGYGQALNPYCSGNPNGFTSPSYGENLNLSSNIGYGQALNPYCSGNANGFTSPSYGENLNLSSNIDYGRALNPYCSGNPNGFTSPSYGENLNLSSNIGYGQALNPYCSGNANGFTSPSCGENLNLSSNIDYGRALNPYCSGNANGFTSPIGYSAGSSNLGASISSAAHNLWDNGDLDFNITPAIANSFAASGIGSILGFDNNNINWLDLSSPPTVHAMNSGSGFNMTNLSYGTGDNTFGLSSNSYPRSNDIGSLNASFAAARNYVDSFGSDSIFGDPTWHTALNQLEGSNSICYGLGATASDVIARGSIDYTSGYDVTNRQINRDA